MLRLVALGHTNAEISQKLYLSVRTVESHRANIQQKAGRTPAPISSPTRASRDCWTPPEEAAQDTWIASDAEE